MTRNHIITIGCLINLLLVILSVKFGWIAQDGFIAGAVVGFVLYHFADLLNQYIYKR